MNRGLEIDLNVRASREVQYRCSKGAAWERLLIRVSINQFSHVFAGCFEGARQLRDQVLHADAEARTHRCQFRLLLRRLPLFPQ